MLAWSQDLTSVFHIITHRILCLFLPLPLVRHWAQEGGGGYMFLSAIRSAWHWPHHLLSMAAVVQGSRLLQPQTVTTEVFILVFRQVVAVVRSPSWVFINAHANARVRNGLRYSRFYLFHFNLTDLLTFIGGIENKGVAQKALRYLKYKYDY